MRITCGVLAILYGLVIGMIIGPFLIWMPGDGPAWTDRIVKSFAGAATVGAWGLIVGGWAVLRKKSWGARLLIWLSAIVLMLIYVGTAVAFWGYVDGHIPVLVVTPFLVGLMVILRWSWLQPGGSGFASPLPETTPCRWRFTTKPLVVLALIVVVWLSWRAANLQQAKRETQVADELGKEAFVGGRVGGSITCVRLNASANDDHVRLLAKLPMLRFLTIDKSRISDDALSHLKSLTRLLSLDLKDVPITSEALTHLHPLHLQLLAISGLRDAGAGLDQLNKLSELKCLELDMSGTNITDDDTEHLTGVKALTDLRLNGTHVTDAGLEHLRGMAGLRFLCLNGTKVTNEGVTKLKQALPNCTVAYK